MGQCRQTGYRLCQKQMEKKQWMSLQVFSCKPEVCRAREGGKGGRNAAVRGSMVSHGLGAGSAAGLGGRMCLLGDGLLFLWCAWGLTAVPWDLR